MWCTHLARSFLTCSSWYGSIGMRQKLWWASTSSESGNEDRSTVRSKSFQGKHGRPVGVTFFLPMYSPPISVNLHSGGTGDEGKEIGIVSQLNEYNFIFSNSLLMKTCMTRARAKAYFFVGIQLGRVVRGKDDITGTLERKESVDRREMKIIFQSYEYW